MSTVTRRHMLHTIGYALGGATLAQAAGFAQETQTKRPPNIIFILADDLGYGDLGCYGQDLIDTPSLDRLAAEGTRFTQCYAGSTVCAPSRCCLMTGLHTGHARVRGNKRIPLRPQDTTVAEVLKKAGYTTALIGKWGLGEPDTSGVPNRKGFDDFYGYLNQRHAHNYFPDHLWRNEMKEPIEGNVLSKDKPGVSVKRGAYSHDLCTQEALDYVERKKDSPFFLYLAYTVPHANNERGRHEGDGMEIPHHGLYAELRWPEPQRGHAAMINKLDTDVGRLMAKLKDLGIDDNTIVFFSSDNGTHSEGGARPEFFESSGPLRGIKRDLYEGGIRVPGIVRWPGRVPANTVSDQVWAFWDFLPTAAELAGVKPPEGLDGISILPALLGGKTVQRDPLYWEFHEGGYKRAVLMGHWKAVSLRPGKRIRLYDLSQDIGETTDLASKHPDIIARVEAYLEQARSPSETWPGTTE